MSATDVGTCVSDPDMAKPMAAWVDPFVRSMETKYLTCALRLNSGRIEDTAITAGISRRTLLRKMKAYGIDKRAFIPFPSTACAYKDGSGVQCARRRAHGGWLDEFCAEHRAAVGT